MADSPGTETSETVSEERISYVASIDSAISLVGNTDFRGSFRVEKPEGKKHKTSKDLKTCLNLKRNTQDNMKSNRLAAKASHMFIAVSPKAPKGQRLDAAWKIDVVKDVPRKRMKTQTLQVASDSAAGEEFGSSCDI